MKRVYVLLLSILMFIFILLGCSNQYQASDNSNVQSSNSEAKSTTTLTVWSFVELHRQFWNDACKTWNKNNPNNKIMLNSNIYPYDEMHNKLQIALQSGWDAPDLVDIELTRFPSFLSGNISLIPLNKIIEPVKDKLFMDRFDIYAKNGNYYGVDYHRGSTVTFYNTEILNSAGVDPDDIKLWSDYVKAGKKVKEITGKPMTTIEVSNMWSFYPLISQQGSDYLDKNGNVQLDNEINIKTLQFLKDMLYKDKIAIISPGREHNKEDYYDFMNNGGAASVTMPLWYMGRFLEYMPDLKGKMTIRPMPTWEVGGNRSAGIGGTGTAITNQCKNIDLAMEFLEASKLTEEGALKCWTILGFDPVYKEVYNEPAFLCNIKFTNYFGNCVFPTLNDIMNEINPINMGDLYTDAATGVARTVIFKVLKEQSQTPEEALHDLSEQIRNKGSN